MVRAARVENALLVCCGAFVAAWAVAALFGHGSLALLAAAGIAGIAYLCVSQLRVLLHWPRRGQAATGTRALIGARGRAIEPLRPEGRVRVGAEVWRARVGSGTHLDAGASVVVREVRDLELVVEPG